MRNGAKLGETLYSMKHHLLKVIMIVVFLFGAGCAATLHTY